MADTKQAAAEAVCEKCGERILYLRDFGWMHCDTHGTPDHYATPRTQPSQELRIPDDRKRLCIACGEPADHAHKGGYSMCGACCGLWGLSLDGEFGEEVHEWIKKLIERIARLEGGR